MEYINTAIYQTWWLVFLVQFSMLLLKFNSKLSILYLIPLWHYYICKKHFFQFAKLWQFLYPKPSWTNSTIYSHLPLLIETVMCKLLVICIYLLWVFVDHSHNLVFPFISIIQFTHIAHHSIESQQCWSIVNSSLLLVAPLLPLWQQRMG